MLAASSFFKAVNAPFTSVFRRPITSMSTAYARICFDIHRSLVCVLTTFSSARRTYVFSHLSSAMADHNASRFKLLYARRKSTKKKYKNPKLWIWRLNILNTHTIKVSQLLLKKSMNYYYVIICELNFICSMNSGRYTACKHSLSITIPSETILMLYIDFCPWRIFIWLRVDFLIRFIIYFYLSTRWHLCWG